MINVADLYSMPMPNQNEGEWGPFMEFCAAYFENRGIIHPIVVEIGTHTYYQKPFYEKFLGARHIGIDITDKYAKPDILGDSHDPNVRERLKALLSGELIKVLFIDADHEYESVKKDYEMYSPLAFGIVALHDIICIEGPGQLWHEIIESKRDHKEYTFLTFGQWGTPKYQTGIGVMYEP